MLHSRGDGNFDTVYPHGNGGNGIGGFNLANAVDRVIPIRFNSDKLDDLLIYRPGRGAIFILQSNGDSNFESKYAVGDNGCSTPNGIDGYDLLS